MYEALRVSNEIAETITVNSPIWDKAPKSPRYVNIVNGEFAMLDTRTAVLWSKEHLFVRYWAQEPHIAATMTERDQLLFNENNVELFIDGGDFYYELEVNALNVVYEVFFAWRDHFDKNMSSYPDLNPLEREAYTFGGNNDRESKTFWKGTHPRGVRWAYTDWDMAGLHTEVNLRGTLNDPSDTDDGWDALVRIPWESLSLLANGRTLPPQNDDVWSFQFARYELIPELKTNIGWAWTPVGDKDNHMPEKFTDIRFVDRELK